MKYLALLCADLHVKRRVDEQFALEQIVSAAIKHRVRYVVAAGDLFDRQTNRSEPVTYFYTQLTRLQEAGIVFHYLQGQHDMDEPTWLGGHAQARHLHKETLDLGHWCAYGLDYQPFGKLQEELAEIPRDCNLLIAHQTWGDWMGSIASPQGDFAQVPGHVAGVFSGDLHKWVLENRKNADGAQMICVSPGATAMQKIDEPARHHYALLDAKGNFHRQTLRSRVFIDWPVMNFTEDVDRFMAEIEAELAEAAQTAAANNYPEAMTQPYLRVTYSHKLSDVLRRVEKVVAGRAIHYWKELPPEDKQPRKDKLSKTDVGAAVTPLTVLPGKVDKEEKPEVFALASRLLAAPNYEEEFQRWWHETLEEGS